MDNPPTTLVRASPLKALLVKLMEAAGLSLVSFCVFMFLAKVFSPNPGVNSAGGYPNVMRRG